MYPPAERVMERPACGTIMARSQREDTMLGPDGSNKIIERETGNVLFHKPGEPTNEGTD
jgi:hypothetical protein